MIVGVPKEIKPHEYRVGLTPSNIAALTDTGHQCLVETNAGAAIGFTDDDYQQAGADVCTTATEVYAKSGLIVKVKEPQPQECALLQPNQLVFGFFHLAANKMLAEKLMQSGAMCIAYETITNDKGQLPLLSPMSEIAGRFAVQAGAQQLENPRGGNGILLGGATGAAKAKVVIIGAGVVGSQAADVAVGMGADVVVLDREHAPLDKLAKKFPGRLKTLIATEETITAMVVAADMVIGAVLISGAAAPKVISRELVKKLKPGTVLVDVAIDQGGCFETSRPTTHDNPTYLVDDVIHYCVANIPGAVARTATQALTHATFSYVLRLADEGINTLQDDEHFAEGVNVAGGVMTHPVVAKSLGMPYQAVTAVLSQLKSRG